MTGKPKHRILLVNFTDEEAKLVANGGFNVERGSVGNVSLESGVPFLPYFVPHPIYDYDVHVYNSAVRTVKTSTPSSPKNLLFDRKNLETLQYLGRPPRVRISFIGQCDENSDLFVGVPFVKLVKAHEDVAVLQGLRSNDPFSIGEMQDLIRKLADGVAHPVQQYLVLKPPSSGLWPLHHYPVVVNRNGDVIAAYGTVYDGGLEPVYVILPQLRNNAVAALEILKLLVSMVPGLFPDLERRTWYDSDEFALSEQIVIKQEIQNRVEQVKRFIEEKQEEKEEIAKRFSFLKEILVATEGAAIEPDHRLSANVKRTLEFLGFKVDDQCCPIIS